MQKTGGVDLLTYNLYTDAAATTVWGDDTGGTATQKLAGNSPSATLTVFGKADAGQDVPAGSYTDTVVITVNF
jgi:spore coat protein U-like protein